MCEFVLITINFIDFFILMKLNYIYTLFYLFILFIIVMDLKYTFHLQVLYKK